MKKKFFSILFALALVVMLVPVTAVPVSAATDVWVDDDWAEITTGDDPDGDGPATSFGTDAFATIQEGITAVDPSGTVNVAAGTYLQGDQINVDKSLVIQGAGREDTEVRRAGTPVYGEYWRVFDVTAASDVTISDMSVGYETLLPATTKTPVPGYVIAHRADYSPTDNLTIDNVAFDGGRSAILSSGTGLVVQNCLFTGEWQRASIRPTGTNFLITGNEFQGLHYQFGPAMLSGNAVEGEISYNQMSNGAIPGYFKTSGCVFTIESYTNATGTENLVIKNNTFDGTNRTDVVKEGGDPLYTRAIYFEGAGYDGSKIFIQDNPTFTGYDYGVWVPGTTTISGNKFNSNGTQLGLYEAVGGIPETAIDDILANNTFDRAVVVEHPGASLLPEIWSSIQDGIDAAQTDDTVKVAKGTYSENVVVDESLTLQGEDRETTTIEGPEGTTLPTLTISIAGVIVSGFTIQSGPDIEPAWTIVVKGDSALLTDLHVIKEPCFWPNGDPKPSGAAILLGTPVGGSGVGGVDRFKFTHSVVDSAWNGIYAPRNPGSSNIVVQDVDFTYPGEHAILLMMVTGATIEENTFTCTADKLGVIVTLGSDEIEIAGNQVVGSGSLAESHIGILLQAYAEGTMGDVTILDNGLSGFNTGILVEDVATSGISIHYNSITGNAYGVKYLGSDTVDTTHNWWGDVAGPVHDSNPYFSGPDYTTTGDAVSDYVDYLPWLIQIELQEDWNIYSMPIALDEACLEPFMDALLSANVTAAYYFNSDNQSWGIPEDAGPLDACYLKLENPVTVNIWASSEGTFPAQKVMKKGWNLVGLAELYEMPVDEALVSAFWGTGEANLWGYSQVTSPSLNGILWTYMRDGEGPPMVPAKGYWVFMVNDGVLGGFSSTPIREVTP